MSMSQFMSLFVLLDAVAICSLLIGIITSCVILFIIICKLPDRRSIIYLLLANTCICTLELCLSNLLIYGFIIAYDSQSTASVPSIYDQAYLCPMRSYFLFSGFSLLYTSYGLQVYYRLRQVIFYQKVDSYKAFLGLCLIQWIFSFLLVLPMLLTRSFVYIPTEYFCPIPFTKPLSVAYIAIAVYGTFLAIYAAIYVWIYTYTTRTPIMTLRRRRKIDRQFTMLKRIIFPTASLMFLGVVYLVLFFQTLLNHYQTHFLTYRLSYLFIAVGMSFIHMITILQTPTIRNALRILFAPCTGRLRRQNYDLNHEHAIQSTVTTRRNQVQPIAGTASIELPTRGTF